MTPITQFTDRVIRNVETVIVGKRQQIELLMVAFWPSSAWRRCWLSYSPPVTR